MVERVAPLLRGEVGTLGLQISVSLQISFQNYSPGYAFSDRFLKFSAGLPNQANIRNEL